MKRMCFAAAIAASSLFVDAPALAQNFTGFRAEVHGGWDRLKIEDEDEDFEASDSGVTYGVGLGYDFALGGRLIAGVEANFDLADTRLGVSDAGVTASVRAKRDIEVSARIGAAVSDGVLLYGKAGYSNARFRAGVSGGGIDESLSGNSDGLRLGAGMEFALGRNAYAKAEYRYSNYDGGATRDQVIGGVGFRF